jgi:hypothetical protein
VGVQEVRWDKERTVRAGDYTFFYGKGNENHQFRTGFFVHQGIVPAVKKVEFVSDRMSRIVLRGRWCNIILLNAHTPTEEKNDNSKDSFYEVSEQVFDHFPKYLVTILLGEFIAKLRREDIFKPKIGNESLHEDSNDNGIKVANFPTSKNLVVKSTMFPHRNIHNYTWTSPDGQTQNQIDHKLIDRRWLSSILDVRSFRGADCDSDHYLVVAKVRERLSGRKQAAQETDVKRFNIKRLSEMEVRKEFQIEISNRFQALDNL